MLPATANPSSSGVTLGDIAGELIAVGLQQKEFDQTQIALVGQNNPSRNIYDKLVDIEKVLAKNLSGIRVVAHKQFELFENLVEASERRRDMSALQTEATGTALVPSEGNVYEGEVVRRDELPPTTQPEQDTELTDQQSLARKLFGGLLAIGGGAAFLDVMENVAARNDPSLSAEQQERASDRLTGQAVGGVAGIAGGALAGAKLGGTLGTIFGPVGTGLGIAAGAAAGGVLGILFGDDVTDVLLDDIVPNLTEGFEIFKEGLSKDVEQLGETFSKIGEDLSTGFDKVVEDTGKSLSAAAEAIGLPSMEEVGNFFSSLNPFSDDGGPSFAEMREEAGRPKGYDPTTGRPLSGGQNTGVPTVEEQRAEDRRVRRNRPKAPTTRPSLARTSSARSQEAAALTGAPDNPYVFDSQQKAGEAGMLLQKARPEIYGGYRIEPMDDETYFLRMLTKEQVAENQAKMKAAGMDFFKDGGTLEPGKMGVVGEGQDGIPGTDDDSAEFVTTSQPVDIIPRHKIKAYNELKSTDNRKIFDSFMAEQDLNTGYEALISELSYRGSTTGDFLPKDQFGKSDFKVKGIGYDIDQDTMDAFKEYPQFPDAFQSKMGIMPKLGDFRGTVQGFGGTKNRYLNKEDFLSSLEDERDIAELLSNPEYIGTPVSERLEQGQDAIQSSQSQPIVVNAPQSSSPTINNTTVTRQLPTMSPRTHDESFTRTNNQNYNFG